MQRIGTHEHLRTQEPINYLVYTIALKALKHKLCIDNLRKEREQAENALFDNFMHRVAVVKEVLEL